MSWKADLLARLRADATLTGLLGTRSAWSEANREWGDQFPQLVLNEISPGRDYTHGGADGLDAPRLQFDIYASTASSAEAVAAALASEMEQEGVTQGDTRFGFGFLEDRSGPSPEDLSDQARVHRLRVDYIFHHETV